MSQTDSGQEGCPRIGVIGVGSLGYHHARVVRDLPGVMSAGVFDTDGRRVTQVVAELGVVGHDSLDALLDECDAVVIAVPTTHHEAVALAALERGLAVFVEKPLAHDLDSAARILDAAETADAIVQVGHVERFNAGLLAARPFIERPLFIESHRLAPFTPRSLDVAVVLDLMIHDVDLVESLVGEPVSGISATGIPVLTPNIDVANARLEFAGGAVANLTASRISMKRMRKLRIWQPSGYLSLDLAAGSGEFYRAKGGFSLLAEGGVPDVGDLPADLGELVERIPIQGDGVEPLRREMESFRDAILGLSPVPVGGGDGRRALELSLAIEELIKNHVADTRSATS